MALLTLVTVATSQRKAAEQKAAKREEPQEDWHYDDGQIT
jgi:hypothetical protein